MKRSLGILLLLACLGAAMAANITFQVNMAVQQRLGNFNPAVDTVLVRGTFNGWGGYTDILTTVPPDSVYRITKSLSPGPIEYRFVMANRAAGGDRWENIPYNRTHTVTGNATLPVVYFNDQSSSAIYDLEILFCVNMGVQILMGNFNPDVDLIQVRGNTPPLQWGGAANVLPEVPGFPGLYADWIQFDNLPYPGLIQYKFVILQNGDPYSPIWEQIPGGGNRHVEYTGTEPDDLPPPSGNGYQEILLDTAFYSDITFEDVTENPVDVVFACDVRPAYYKIDDIGYIVDVQTGEYIYAIESVGICGLFDQWSWGYIPEDRQMHDNGIAPDEVPGDSIWTLAVHFDPGDPRIHSYKYAINGYDVEAGFAQNHELEINDTQPVMMLPMDCFGIIGNLYDDYIWVCELIPTENIGYVTLISLGPPNWGYWLHWVSGRISHLVFTNFCSGTVGSVSGAAAAAGWTATNYADSIVFTTTTPLTSGSIATF